MKCLPALCIAAAASVLTLPAFADNYPAPPAQDQGYPDQGPPGQGYNQPQDQHSQQQRAGRKHHMKEGRMSREERLAWRAEIREATRGMPKDQRRAFRQQKKAEWRSMDANGRHQ